MQELTVNTVGGGHAKRNFRYHYLFLAFLPYFLTRVNTLTLDVGSEDYHPNLLSSYATQAVNNIDIGFYQDPNLIRHEVQSRSESS